MPPQSRVLLYRLLQGETPTAAELAGLVRAFEARREVEGQWFDLKAGALIRERNGDALRAAACGFANAEGGFLLIGYHEGRQAFDHVAPIGRQEPEQWVTDALGSIAHMIPPPRFATVDIGGPVLLVAFERARGFVCVIEKGEPVYYVRFGHQTLPMPPSHVTDLLLGRRAQPELRVVDLMLGVQGQDFGRAIEIRLGVRLENDALTVAEGARVGLVSWTGLRGRDVPQRILQSIDVAQPPADLLGRTHSWHLSHAVSQRRSSGGRLDLEPFESGGDDVTPWRLPLFGSVPTTSLDSAHQAQARGAVETSAALYVLARNAEPSWWQLRFRYDGSAHGWSPDHARRCLRIESCLYSRPVVSVRFLREDEFVELGP